MNLEHCTAEAAKTEDRAQRFALAREARELAVAAGDLSLAIKTIDELQGSVRTRVLRPEHLAAIALRVGRPKDLVRITQFLEENAVEHSALCDVVERHGLKNAWQLFCKQTGIIDPCDRQRR